MHWLQNDSPYQALIFPFQWPDEIVRSSLLVKGSFVYDQSGYCQVAEQASPLVYVDEPWAPGRSIRQGMDLAPFKPATDLIISGDAALTEGSETQRLQVQLEILQRLRKAIDVVGPRQWQYGLLRGWHASDPQPFSRMPIRWELAYGGMDQNSGARFEQNPWGCGFAQAGGGLDVTSLTVPCLEHPGKPIGRFHKQYRAVGLSYVSADMAPRCQYLGTYDEQWQKERQPFLAEDFDFRYFQQAPQDQIISPYLQGHETISLTNMAPFPQQLIALESINSPKLAIKQQNLNLNLDTVHIVANEQRLELCWRLVLPADTEKLRLYS